MRKVHFQLIFASLLFATSVSAQTFPEVEPNSARTEATPIVGIAAGGVITGTTTGVSTTLGSTLVTTTDMFRVKTGALPIALYEHRLTLTTNTVGHTGTIRGLSQTGGAACVGGSIPGTDLAAQTTLTTSSPPRYDLWYGFGKQEELYYRVDGTGATTAPYGAVMSTTTVSPTVIATAFDSNGPITISTVGLTGVDTELVLYDSTGTLVGQNDHECPAATAQSKLTRTLAPGTYWLGVSTFELCVNQPAPVDDAFIGGLLIDFPDCVVLSSAGTASSDWDFEIRGCNGVFNQVNQSPAGSPFVVTWFQFTASPGAPPISIPANDNCASATPLTVGTITASISTATRDGTASCDPGGGASKDLWYSFNGGIGGGTLTVNTCSSTGVDTVLTVFNGCGGSEVACSDDCGGSPCAGPTSCITASLAPNQAVLVRVSDKGLGGCEFKLTTTFGPTPPPNDLCTSPIAIAGPGVYPFDTTAATDGQGTTGACGGPPIKNLWYAYTPSTNGTVTISTCGQTSGTTTDTEIWIYTGAGCPVGAALACNDDAPSCSAATLNSIVTAPVTCGTTYMIELGNYTFATGGNIFGTFTLSEVGTQCATPTTPFCLGDGTGVPCPCSPTPNNGSPGHGCGSQAFPGGAILTTTGIASDETGVGTVDTLTLIATDIPGPALFIQANGLIGAIPFGDGQLCAAIGIIRLGVVFPTANVASYPGGTTPNEIHLQGFASAGQTKHYQAWYRSVPGVCTVGQNYDLTQGLSLVWQN